MRSKHKENKSWDTMTFAERGEYMQQAEENIRQYGNKELLLLFCLMKETGIRFGDILELRTENVQGRELLVVERKYNGADYYRNPNGSLPVISEETAALLVSGEDGRFFHNDRSYYSMLFRRVLKDKGFICHWIRQYVMEMRRMSQ